MAKVTDDAKAWTRDQGRLMGGNLAIVGGARCSIGCLGNAFDTMKKEIEGLATEAARAKIDFE